DPGMQLRHFTLSHVLVEVATRPVVLAERSGFELWLDFLANRHHVAAARVEPAALGREEQRRRLAWNLHQPLDVLIEAGQRSEQTPGVGVLWPREEGVHGPSSWIRAADMTTTSSAVSATTPRSCVMIRIALPKSRCSLFIRSRICA